MKTFTYEVVCSVTVRAENEAEARAAVVRSCQEQDEDVLYGEMGVYIPSYGSLGLVDVYEETDQ
jgi:hypothetical protein